MSKIALIGDTHWGVKGDSASFHRSFKEYYDWMFSKLKELGIKDCIQLGDLYDRRKFINFKTLYESRRTFLDPLNRDFNSHILAGNHDTFFRNTNEVNSVGLLLREYENISVYESEPKTIIPDLSNLDFSIDVYPWICPENYSECMEFAKNSTSKVAVGHFEFADFEMHKGTVADHGMAANIFKSYTWVFSGHYHTYSQKGNVVYAGVPYEMSWSDFNDPKGIIILDTETLEWERLMTPFQKFVRIVYDDKNGTTTSLDTLNIQDCFVKLVVVNKTDYYAYDQYLGKLLTKGAEDVKIVEDSIVNSIENVDTDNLEFDDTPTLMEQFVDQLEVDLEKGKLKSILRGLYIEASNQ